MRTTIILLFYLFYSYGLFAQVGLDSLYEVWQDEKRPDSIRIEALTTFVKQGFVNHQPDSATLFIQRL